ncbi:hypothetical protein [Kribbella sp. VKM Ac-2569]|uniref:hypothetical protein n=1 Tax=Kribbella sp. VKM Ac-2569 TaxID=2512220 RepID=UPI0013004761|nr:hypothetical protein [Kribbella sp. VKM Ac-2569]
MLDARAEAADRRPTVGSADDYHVVGFEDVGSKVEITTSVVEAQADQSVDSIVDSPA